MSQENILEVAKSALAPGPMWTVILLGVGILCWRSDRIFKELFAGVKGILLAIRHTEKIKRQEEKHKPEPIKPEPQKAMME
jgi:hypothetical protein